MVKRNVQTLEGQSVLDVAVQTAGSVEAAIEMAMVNDLSITDDFSPSKLRTSDVQNKSIAQYYDRNAIKPATAVTDPGQIFEDIFTETFE
ncbi:hypothetical protein [Proteiniphilum sp.]|uniref:hypothetical protein n=1 Tax=Proteiniphilum sp. TaxID=1926877 RepID=UPI002B1F3253|nr:hypothetical protein [Proteiniphilum sp.]MEA4916537.1 hypothetical protein [Proteiniphilum sp.]